MEETTCRLTRYRRRGSVPEDFVCLPGRVHRGSSRDSGEKRLVTLPPSFFEIRRKVTFRRVCLETATVTLSDEYFYFEKFFISKRSEPKEFGSKFFRAKRSHRVLLPSYLL